MQVRVFHNQRMNSMEPRRLKVGHLLRGIAPERQKGLKSMLLMSPLLKGSFLEPNYEMSTKWVKTMINQ